MKICERCKKEYYARRSDQKFCSSDCKKAKTCLVCTNILNHKDSVLCSEHQLFNRYLCYENGEATLTPHGLKQLKDDK